MQRGGLTCLAPIPDAVTSVTVVKEVFIQLELLGLFEVGGLSLVPRLAMTRGIKYPPLLQSPSSWDYSGEPISLI